MLKERPDRDSISRGDDLMDWNPMGHGNLRLPWRSDVAVSILRPAEEKRKKKPIFPKLQLHPAGCSSDGGSASVKMRR